MGQKLLDLVVYKTTRYNYLCNLIIIYDITISNYL